MNINQPNPVPLVSLLIPSCPALEASEVARKLKVTTYNRAYYAAHRDQAAATKRAWVLANHERATATSKAWRTANPDKVAQYNRTYVESLKMKPAPVEVTLSDLLHRVTELKALVMQLVTGRQQTIGSNGGMHPPPPPPPVSNR